MLQAIENRPPDHIRQIDIQRNHARIELASQRQGRRPPQRYQGPHSPVVRHIHKDAGEGNIVLDDQQHRVARMNQVAVVIQFDVVHHHRRRRRGRRQDHIHSLFTRNRRARLTRRTRTARAFAAARVRP